ncbi:hypothetical protein H2204_003212 [Knufia peltigerae]|nr:hypothetical protein H2204_003212 [Knufia peltigerae]
MTTKAGTPFQLYRSTSDATIYYLVGGWRTADEHIAFLSSPQAVEFAKAIGQYVSAEIVQHIEGDIDTLGAVRPKRLRVTLAKLHESEAIRWENQWKSRKGAGGWDRSASVQKDHQAFAKMGEVTDSPSAFGGNIEREMLNWVWIDDAASGDVFGKTSPTGTAKMKSFELEHVLG